MHEAKAGPTQVQPTRTATIPRRQDQGCPSDACRCLGRPTAYPKAQRAVTYAASGSPPRTCIARTKASWGKADRRPSRSQRSAARKPRGGPRCAHEVDDVEIVGQNRPAERETQAGEQTTSPAHPPRTSQGQHRPKGQELVRDDVRP